MTRTNRTTRARSAARAATDSIMSAASPGDKTYLKVQGGNALSVSKFEVDGASVKGGVKGFIYGDRGVWRPGDSLYLNFIMEDKSQILPDGHPVEMKIFDPRDRVITTMVRTQPTGTFYDFRTSTDAEAPTGRYRAEVSVGNRTYYKNLNIETIKPNRLKVEVEFDQSPATGDAISGRLKSAWLHGSPAPHLEADISMGLRASNTTFDGFEAFEFDNTFLDHGGYAVAEVFEGKLDARGEANFSVNMSDKTKGAPGMMTAYFEAKVYEPGGGFSIHNQTLV